MSEYALNSKLSRKNIPFILELDRSISPYNSVLNNHNHFLPLNEYPLAKFNNEILAGGIEKECENIDRLGKNLESLYPRDYGKEMTQSYDVKQFQINADGYKRNVIDNSKLIMPLHVDRTQYESNEDLYVALKDWWINIKGRSPKTIERRICYARSMEKHSIYPVDWLKFEPEQILNQLMHRQIYEYKEKARETGNQTYGITQLNNLWKTVNTFSQAFGIDITYWGWNPPSTPEPQVKIVPRPIMVSEIIHHWYTNNRVENALIRTLLTFGFHSGVRPEELIILKVDDIKFNEGYILIKEQKKRYRERQIWLDDPILYSRQQNSLKNWVTIWRPRAITQDSGDFLFIQKNGKPFPSEDALRMYLAPFVKSVWPYFKPKIMRDWSAIARLIRTKIETKNFDVRVVKNDLGHKHQSTTEDYIKFAENYYRKDPYDWLRAVLKFHKNSKRMRTLMEGEYGTGQEIPKILTKGKSRAPAVYTPSVKNYGPVGVKYFSLLGAVLTNSFENCLKHLHFSLKPFFSFFKTDSTSSSYFVPSGQTLL